MAHQGGILFRELMKGGFAVGQTEPVCGERVGERSGSFLAMEATIAIHDLELFVGDPEHGGKLTGRVSFPPLGTGIPAMNGEFKLFVPTPDPACKAMMYSLGFRHHGRDYCLRGSKYVLKRSVVYSWRDTTTLFCRLHDGTTREAPVIGAGVLHLKAVEFVNQLMSFRTLNTASVREKVGVLARFSTFFARELWGTYLG